MPRTKEAEGLAASAPRLWVQVVQPVRIDETAGTPTPDRSTGFALPTWSGEAWGTWPLAEMCRASRDYWLTPRAALPFPLPTGMEDLLPWLSTQQDNLHPSDGWRLARWASAVARGLQTGSVPRTQFEAWQAHLVGHLTEIAARPEALTAFRMAAERDPSLIVLMEPQIQTPDGRYASDIVMGSLETETRSLTIHRAWEVTHDPMQMTCSEQQQRETLGRRYQAIGIRVVGDADCSECFARLRVVVDPAAAMQPVVVKDPEVTDLAARVLEALCGWHGLVHGVLRNLPREAAVRVRQNTANMSVAGKIAMAAMRILIDDFASQCARSGAIEMEWLAMRLAAAMDAAVSPLVHTQLQRMGTVLANLVARVGHERKTVPALAKELGAHVMTMRDWEAEFVSLLDKRALPVAQRTSLAAKAVEGYVRARQIDATCEAWAKGTAPVEDLTVAIAAIDADLAAIMTNLIVRAGHERKAVKTLANELSMDAKTVQKWEAKFIALLEQKIIPIAPRVGKAAEYERAHAINAACVAWVEGTSPVEDLAAAIGAINVNCARSLTNLIACDGHERKSANALAIEFGVSTTLVRIWEDQFEPFLERRNIPIAPRTGRVANTMEGKKRAPSIEATCEAWAKGTAPVEDLTVAITAIDANLAAIVTNLIARAGHERTAAAALANELSVDAKTVLRWENLFEPFLERRNIPIAPRTERTANILEGRKIAPLIAAACAAWAEGIAPVEDLVAAIGVIDANYALVLTNLIAREDHVRKDTHVLANTLGVNSQTVLNWETKFAPILERRTIPIAPRTGHAVEQERAHAIATACAAWAEGIAPVEGLVATIGVIDANYALVLTNLIAREGHERTTANVLAKEFGISDSAVSRRESMFVSFLERRNIPVAPRTGKAEQMAAYHAGKKGST